MKISSPQKWTEIDKVQRLDGSSQEDENSKSTKVDGYKLKSREWTDHPRRMEIQSPQKMDGVQRLDGSS